MATVLDCLIIGAGFSGIALASELKKRNHSFLLVDRAPSIGGTWQANRYPGARCDTPTVDYAFHTDAEFDKTWEWSEDYATQPEILEYLQRFTSFQQLDHHLELNATVNEIAWDAARCCWQVKLSTHRTIACRFVALALGALSKPFTPPMTNLAQFQGTVLHTASWPHSPPNFRDQHVAILGTGASSIQLVPELANICKQLVIFQRTPPLAMPQARNENAFNNRKRMKRHQRQLFLSTLSRNRYASSSPFHTDLGESLSEAQLKLRFDQLWDNGDLFAMVGIAADLFTDPAFNNRVRKLFIDRIEAQFSNQNFDPSITDIDYTLGTKRICIERGYYRALQQANVQLVSTKNQSLSLSHDSILLTNSSPTQELQQRGLPTVQRAYRVDTIICATGFDPFTGPLLDVDIQGQGGLTLQSHWDSEIKSMLGMLVHGFPNMFLLQAPGSPSVLSNMAQSSQFQANWIARCIDQIKPRSQPVLSVSAQDEARWTTHAETLVKNSLFVDSKSWYNRKSERNANGNFLPYIGGQPNYARECESFLQRL